MINRGPAPFHRLTPNKRFEPVFSTVIMAVCSLFNRMLLLTDLIPVHLVYCGQTVMIGCNHTSFEWTRAFRHIYGIIRHMHGLYTTLVRNMPHMVQWKWGNLITHARQNFQSVSNIGRVLTELWIGRGLVHRDKTFKFCTDAQVTWVKVLKYFNISCSTMDWDTQTYKQPCEYCQDCCYSCSDLIQKTYCGRL